MSVKQIMEGVVRYVPTHKDHECVAADLDTGLVAHAEVLNNFLIHTLVNKCFLA